MPLAKTSPKSNQFFFFLFFSHCKPQKKNLQRKKEMILMMILALLLLFATPFSNEFGGLVGVHGFYLPGVAPQGAIFLHVCLFCLFFFACVLNVVKRQRVKSRTRSLGSQNDADLFSLSPFLF